MRNDHRVTDGRPVEHSGYDKNWITSLAAASAAGLLLAHQGHAAIIQTADSRTVDSTHPQNIDLNGDTVQDITLSADGNRIILSKATSLDKQDYVVDPADSAFVGALSIGEVIDASRTYGTVGIKDSTTKNKSTASLVNTDNVGNTTGAFTVAAGEKFLGLRLELPDGIHFGWVGFKTLDQSAGSLSGQITGFAFENTVDQGIPAGVPEPSSLALLALGAVGLTAYRRRR